MQTRTYFDPAVSIDPESEDFGDWLDAQDQTLIDWICGVDNLQAEHYQQHEEDLDALDDAYWRLSSDVDGIGRKIARVNDLRIEAEDEIFDRLVAIEEKLGIPTRSGAVEARRVHYPEAAGSTPASATSLWAVQERRSDRWLTLARYTSLIAATNSVDAHQLFGSADEYRVLAADDPRLKESGY